MVFEAVRYGMGVDALNEAWGYRVHSVRPARLVASVLRAARRERGLSTAERRALCGGIVSHCALDLALHPLVNYCARRDTARHGGHESTHHRLAEKFHALFFHLERYGEDPIGPAFAARTRITKEGHSLSPHVEPALLRLLTDACRGAYGSCPAPAQWGRWVRNFRQFGLLVSIPSAARNSQRVRTAEMRARYYENPVFDFRDFYASAERRLRRLAWLAYDYMEGGDFSAPSEDAFCAAACIDDLAEPVPHDVPALPLLPPHRPLPLAGATVCA